MYQTTKHGYKIYPADKWHKTAFLFCRDDAAALEDIREIVSNGTILEVHNDFDTFYGCCWGQWLIDGTKDIANSEVLNSWNPGGYCDRPFPQIIRLTPKN